MKAKLVIVGGVAKANDVELDLPAVIGRGRDVSVPLPHPLVSRRHCEIVEQEGQLLVRDLNSLNGTFIGEERISEAVLPVGGLLTVGTVTFRAVYGESAGRQSPKPGRPAAMPPVVNTKPEASQPATSVPEPVAPAPDEDRGLESDSADEVLDVEDIDEIVDIDDALVEEVVDVVDPEPVGSAQVSAAADSAELLDLDEVEIMDESATIAGVDDQTERVRPPIPPSKQDGPVEFAEPDEADLEPPKAE